MVPDRTGCFCTSLSNSVHSMAAPSLSAAFRALYQLVQTPARQNKIIGKIENVVLYRLLAEKGEGSRWRLCHKSSSTLAALSAARQSVSNRLALARGAAECEPCLGATHWQLRAYALGLAEVSARAATARAAKYDAPSTAASWLPTAAADRALAMLTSQQTAQAETARSSEKPDPLAGAAARTATGWPSAARR